MSDLRVTWRDRFCTAVVYGYGSQEAATRSAEETDGPAVVERFEDGWAVVLGMGAEEEDVF